MYDYDNLVKEDIYIKKIGAINILFIGGCRSFAYAIYFEDLCEYNPWYTNAQYGISAIGVHLISYLKRNITKNMTTVIENADIIVCEQIRNYSFLNTSTSCETNLFNSFNLKKNCKIINLPNLEIKSNLLSLSEYCKIYSFNKLSNYIKEIPNLFITYNHPSNNLLVEFMKEFFELYFQKISDTDILNLSKTKIFN